MRKVTYSRDRRGVLHAKVETNNTWSVEMLGQWLRDATGQPKSWVYMDSEDLKMVRLQVLEKRCAVWVSWQVVKRKMYLDVMVSGMLVHDADLVHEYHKGLVNKLV